MDNFTWLCLPGRGEAEEDDGPVVNPRPDWEWPSKRGPVDVVGKSLGMRYKSPCFLDLEVDRLRWFGDRARTDKRGWLALGECDVHADVARIHGRETPVLELSYDDVDGRDRSLRLKFASLDDMNDWWCALSATQQLLLQLDAEEGKTPHRRGAEAEVSEDEGDGLPWARDPTTPRAGRNEHKVKVVRGAFEPALFLTIRRAYEQVLGMIIRPPRAKYGIHQLGPPKFSYGSAGGGRAPPYVRDDFTVVNGRGLRVCASLWRPQHDSEITQAALGPKYVGVYGAGALPLANAPTVVYLHGNASCRVEAVTILSLCAGLGLAVLAIDCAGSGQSDGEYISLGFLEADDVVSCVDFLKRDYGLQRYALWGRSMGSVTALLYASSKAPDVGCVVCDSPFASIKALCYDLVHKAAPSIPDAAVAIAVRKIRKSVKYRTGFDIVKCDPARRVSAMSAPLLVVHGRDDDFILPRHSDAIKAAYGGSACEVSKPIGNHNSRRSYDTYLKIEAFLAAHLLDGRPPRRRVDFLAVSGIPERVENPYLFPPWAFITSPDGKRTALAAPPPKTAKRKSASAQRERRLASRQQTPAGGDSEFVSGMSEARQAEVEAGIGNLFGAKKK